MALPPISTFTATGPETARRSGREPLQGYASMQHVPAAQKLDDLARLYTARTDYQGRSPEELLTLKTMHDGSTEQLAAMAMEHYPLSLEDAPPTSVGRALGNAGAAVDGFFAAVGKAFGGKEPALNSWSSLIGEVQDATKRANHAWLQSDRALNSQDKQELVDIARGEGVRRKTALESLAGHTAAVTDDKRGQAMGGPFEVLFARIGSAIPGQ